jgi:uncharacterized membrane protein YgcG
MAAHVTNGLDVQSPWNANQAAMLPFERVPIVWARRVDGIGGVLVSPQATECKFSTPSLSGQPVANAVTVAYHLVVSDGRCGGVQVRDVFHGRCRVGQFSQSYSKRAGTWSPGNSLAAVYTGTQLVANAVVAPTFCGTTGTYESCTTFSFTVTYFNGFDAAGNGLPDQGFWKRQIHLFIRNGAQTTRLLDNTYGSSNNVADLYLWLLTRNGRTPAQQIDRDSLLTAARFMNANGLFWNGVLREPTSISDWINSIGRFLLVRETKIGGRYGLRPLLPITSTGAIDTSPLKPAWVFDNNAIEPGSYSLAYRDAESRRPFRAMMAWRQQGDDGLSGITRTSEASYADTPGYAPIETFDLTQFCTSEIHAIRAGIFEQAKRRYCTHAARVTVVPGAYDNRLREGDLIALQLNREDINTGVSDPVIEWYWLTSMSAGREGRLILDLEHCPVDSLSRSLVALDVANATALGDQFITGATGPSCDEDPSRATDTSIPAEDAVSRTREEVYFYNKNGRFPDNNEYAPTPGGQPVATPGGGSSGGGGGGGGGNGGGGGGGAQPPRNSPSQPNNPYGPPNWPGGPTGQPAKGKPPLPTPPPPATRARWIVVMSWKNGIDESVLLYEETVTTFGVGEGYCYIAGTTGFGSGLSVDIAKVDTVNNTEGNYLTNNLGTGGIGFEFQGATLVYRDPDNPNNPEGRADSIGDGVRY